MSLNYGYHITYKSYINSILKNGLVPSVGKNSMSVNEQQPLIYFTTFDYIDTWIERFNLDKDQIIILKFPYDEFGKRYDTANDMFITTIVEAIDIMVIDNNIELPLEEYYKRNKDLLDIETKKTINSLLKTIAKRLKQIEFVSLKPEDSWDYNETEPNLVDILEALKLIKNIDNKEQYKDVSLHIKKTNIRETL